MSLKETTQEIRNKLKAKGWSSRQISVTGRYCGYSSSIDVTIKDPTINIEQVEKIANNYEHYDVDPYSGEILQGGNNYVFVQYAWGLFDEVSKDFERQAQELLDKAQNNNGYGVRLHNDYFLFDKQNGEPVPFIHSNEHGAYIRIYDVQSLSKILYQLKTFNKALSF